MLRFLFILLLALVGLAFGQEPPADLPDVSFDPRVWVTSAAALAAVVFAVVGFLKEHVLTGLRGAATIGLSFGLAVVTAVVLSFTSVYEATLVEAVGFGITAAVLASGGWDGIKGAFRKGAAEAPHVVDDLPPSRKD